MRIAVASCSIALVVGCLFGCSSDSNGAQGSGSVSCRQKADADNNSDCTGFAGKPRKLDCDLDSQTNEAVAAGCVLEKAGGSDVCCPTSVSGHAEAQIGCTEPGDTLTDSDCAGTQQPRKLDCTTSALQQQGLNLGCRAESPGSTTDFDLCCPTHVRGGQ
ncbi:MAG: hypothetical protein IT375_24870 [Polyangiaceae bacterium]|mgnify:CR=1 FL=1|nr:hypothetical protein [Polyangiaceae bacterium]